jgi:hypothetical protein
LKAAISCIEGVVSVPFAADLQQTPKKAACLQNPEVQNALINRAEGAFTGGAA